MKKIYSILLLVIAFFAIALADNTDKILRIYHDGSITSIPLSEIVKISHSKYDADNVLNSENVTSVFETIDETYNIPINSIDSANIVNLNEESNEYYEEIYSYILAQEEQELSVFQTNLISWLNNKSWVYSTFINDRKDNITITLENGISFYINFQPVPIAEGAENNSQANEARKKSGEDVIYYDVSNQQGEKILDNLNILDIQCMNMLSIFSRAEGEVTSIREDIENSPLKCNLEVSLYTTGLEVLDKDFKKYGLIIISQTHGYLDHKNGQDIKGPFQIEDDSAYYPDFFGSRRLSKGYLIYYDNRNYIKKYEKRKTFLISPEYLANKLEGNNDAIVYGSYCWSFGLADFIKGNTVFGYQEESNYFYNSNALKKFVKELVFGATVYDANKRVDEAKFEKWDSPDNQPSLNNNSKERYFSISANELEYDEGQIIVSGIINGYNNFKDEFKKDLKGIIYEHKGSDKFTPVSNGVKKYEVDVNENEGTFTVMIPNDNYGYFGYAFGFDKYYGETKTISLYTLDTKQVEDNEKGETSAILKGSIQGDLTCDGIVGFYYAEVAGTPLEPETERVFVTAGSLSGLQDGNFYYELTGLKPNTQYVFNTYAEVDGNRFYGVPLPFQTKNALEVETGGYTYNDNDPTKVTLLGTIPNFSLFDMDEQGLEVGFVYDTHQSLNIDNAQYLTIYPIGDPNFSGLAENLEELTTYYYAAYIKKGEQISYGEEKSFTTKRWLSIKTQSASNIDSKSATLNGQVYNLDKITDDYELGFYYGTDENLTTSSNYISVPSNQNNGGVFSVFINNLSPETEYYYMASIKVGGETLKGNIMKFQTKKEEDDIEINIETQEATDVTSNTAQLNGSVEGLEELTGEYQLGFYYGNSRDIDPSSAQYVEMLQQNENHFSAIIENLSPETDYYFMAAIDINGNKQYGNVFMLHTLQKEIVKTIGSSDIEANSAKLLGQVIDFQQEDYADVQGEVGFVIGTSNNLTLESLSSTKIKVSSIQDLTSGDFFAALDELQELTTYYYAAYIIADNVTSYGEVKDFTTPRLLNVKTLGVGNIKASSAQVLGQVFNLNSITEEYNLGFYYSKDSDPGSANGIFVPSQYTDTDGSFYADLSGLESDTQYYYVAVIIVGGETIFSKDIGSFKTEETKPRVADPVDLGLSVKWASWNLGAGVPEEYGGLYAIGELHPKKEFSSENYLVDTNIKGCFSATQYDAAFNTWGKEWRLPTSSEIYELLGNCTKEYTEQNGVKGVKITGKNGNSIFLPSNNEEGTSDFYLTGDCTSNTVHTLRFYYLPSYLMIDEYENALRFNGFPIRPVYDPDFKEMSVETLDASNLKVYSATINGKVENPHWRNTTEIGFYYNTTGDPKEGDGEYISINKSGEFSHTLSDLAPNTTYYYVVAAKILGTIYYGDVKSFTTVKRGIPSSAQSVDLGLSVNWAGHNVGASSPTDIGNYFPWGMTEEPYSITYQLYEHKDGDKIKKIGENISGTKYDAARHNMGGSWRMPTIEEWSELFNLCTIENYIMDGVKGISVTGPNGNCIFLPVSGYKTFARIELLTEATGFYWSATYYNDRGNDYDKAQGISFGWSESKLNNPQKTYQTKSTGYVVRAVKNK